MATNTVNVNFKLKADDKRLMESACRELGLSMSAAFTIFAKKVGRERRIPFEVSADPFDSEENLSRLKKAIDEVEAGRKQLVPHDLIEEYNHANRVERGGVGGLPHLADSRQKDVTSNKSTYHGY